MDGIQLNSQAKALDVLIVVPSISRIGGGVSEVVRLVNSALRQQSDVVTEIWAFADADSDASVSLYEGTRIRLFKPVISKRFGFSPQMISALIRRRPRFVYVHGLWMFHCLAVHLWSKLTGGKYAVVPHGMLEAWILARSGKLKSSISNLYQNSFLTRAAFVQALTKKEISDVDMAVPGCRNVLIPNFVDVPSTPPGPPRWFDESLKGKRIYLYFGRIHEKKGCLELLRAWRRACDASVTFKNEAALIFAGWVDQLEGFEALVGELASTYGNVHYVGPQYADDKLATLSAASFVILPSHSEGLPMVILEGWAAGRPALMTAACNLSDGFERGAAVEITSNEAELAVALEASSRLSDDELASMGAAARTLVSSNYSRGAVARALVSAFSTFA